MGADRRRPRPLAAAEAALRPAPARRGHSLLRTGARAARPRRTFVVTTVALTAISLIPDALVEASTGSKTVLMLTHLVAAAIIVPAYARRLER